MDGQKIATYADLSGYINTKRPNDKIQVTYTRNGKNNVVPVVLSKMNSQVLNLKESN
jgi:S1-C subfamily serine protease